MYAVIETGGKQHRVCPGEVVKVESLPGDAGSSVTFDRVLLVGDGDSVRVGTPALSGARVRATVVAQVRGPKIVIYTYKKTKNANRGRAGHRQSLTTVKIEAIEA